MSVAWLVSVPGFCDQSCDHRDVEHGMLRVAVRRLKGDGPDGKIEETVSSGLQLVGEDSNPHPPTHSSEHPTTVGR